MLLDILPAEHQGHSGGLYSCIYFIFQWKEQKVWKAWPYSHDVGKKVQLDYSIELVGKT